MKELTEQQVLGKLTAICARAEHCKLEMRRKMDRWEIPADMQQRVMDYLVEEKYIDEERYARGFINDKIKYNKWGRKKVEQALYLKAIPKEIYSPILDEMEEESFEEILLPLLRNKKKTVKGNSDYEIRMKLIRFALQRGFSYEQTEHCMRKF